MILYQKDNIVISTLENDAIPSILKYFSENDFNCDYETGAFRPTNSQFKEIMEEILTTSNKTSEVLIIKKNNKCIGYLSFFVEYDRLCLGHIAIDRNERRNGYGRLLVLIAIEIANNEGRDVSLTCYYNDPKCLKGLGFVNTRNRYIHKCEPSHRNIPKIFITEEEYEAMQEEKMQKEIESFKDFLNSDFYKNLKL